MELPGERRLMNESDSESRFPRGVPRDLPSQALSIWAKSVINDPSDHHFLRLWQHLEDTEETAGLIWRDFLSDNIKDVLVADLGGRAQALTLYRFLAAVHDVGKASPAFEVQRDWLADVVRQAGLPIGRDLEHEPGRSAYRHELVGYRTIEAWMGVHGLVHGDGRSSFAHGLACIVAGHHGSAIDRAKKEILDKERASEFLGGADWETVRESIVDWAMRATGFDGYVTVMSTRPIRKRSQILLTGMVIIADWIASNSSLFPLNASDDDLASFDAGHRAADAWRRVHLPSPWRAPEIYDNADAVFASRFAIPEARLRPMQREAIHMAREMKRPGLMIIEANMGEGKTEAALLSAEILARRFHMGGVYYALPSQATANAMFTRFLEWIGRLPADSRRSVASLFLAHGKRELNPEFERLRENWFSNDRAGRNLAGTETTVFGDDDPHARGGSMLEATVNSWLDGRKRGNLSDFVIGTIDQVLMAGLKSRHVVLRHLALAGKVVILDEIHSNTAYMNVYMTNVLSWLGAYHVPVIMLSATLPQSRREAFLEAYEQGAEDENTTEPLADFSDAGVDGEDSGLSLDDRDVAGDGDSEASPDVGDEDDGSFSLDDLTPVDEDDSARPNADATSDRRIDYRYPLISLSAAGDDDCNAVTVTPAPSGRSIPMRTRIIADDDETLVNILRERLRDGGCAVVIRNTVSRAQHTFDLLRRTLDVDVVLDHSRFLAFDRARIDRDLIRRFGKHSIEGTRTGVVVATQVVEQSLDVDFDLMVTDVAPIDLILQRSGRLHRHNRGRNEESRPAPLREARLYLTGIREWRDSDAPLLDSGSEKIYTRHLLLRTLAILGLAPGKERIIRLPDDISHLVQSAYSDDAIGPDSWRDSMLEARAEFDERIGRSEGNARLYRIPEPQSDGTAFRLDGWLSNAVEDPDVQSLNKEQRSARASVREGDDSFEVIVLQKGKDGTIGLPAWGDFDQSDPLPMEFGQPSPRQIHDVLTCSISLGRSALTYLNLDAVITAMEDSAPDEWFDLQQRCGALRGQLMVLLDPEGGATFDISDSHQGRGRMVIRVHYSKTRGWEATREG